MELTGFGKGRNNNYVTSLDHECLLSSGAQLHNIVWQSTDLKSPSLRFCMWKGCTVGLGYYNILWPCLELLFWGYYL